MSTLLICAVVIVVTFIVIIGFACLVLGARADEDSERMHSERMK